MLKGEPNEWLVNIYKHYSVKPVARKISLSPTIKKKLTLITDIGLMTNMDSVCLLKSPESAKKKNSIKLGELISQKQRNSMICKAGLTGIVNNLKFRGLKMENTEVHSGEIPSQCSIGKSSATTFKVLKKSKTKEVVGSVVSPKARIKDINPLFFKRINEVKQKTKGLVDTTRNYSNKIKAIKKSSTNPKLVNPKPKITIEHGLNL